ncbi:MAG: amidase domain-containing protein, partial [Clostridium sp.]
HSAFSGKLYAGDIIGYDGSSDGDWDHLGFITQADDYTANYGGKIYYDYKVAQHTTDYHAWTSTSTNGWENLGDSGYTYGLIRD